jgi:hypothetical protein
MTSINRAFLKIACAVATMTAILLVSSGDALAKVTRKPDRGGQVVAKSYRPTQIKRVDSDIMGTAHIRHPQRRF